jgi:hypothetical protein
MFWLPALMLVVAGWVGLYGVQIVERPALGAPPWLGWLLIAVAVLKATIWLFAARLRFRYMR